MPSKLDALPRPLTAREIAQILISMLAGVSVVDPPAAASFALVLRAARTIPDHPIDCQCDLAPEVRSLSEVRPASWAVALWATVSGFFTWCHADQIRIALEQTEQQLHTFVSLPS